MRAAGNLAGVTFISPPRHHHDQEQWREIITESGYFFTADAMRWFSSRILWDTLEARGEGFLFITSEQHTAAHLPRTYTLRTWTVENGTDTLGVQGEHLTRAAAMKALGHVVSDWVKAGCNA